MTGAGAMVGRIAGVTAVQDTAAVGNVSANIGADGMHPSKAGYGILANLWYQAIMAQLSGVHAQAAQDDLSHNLIQVGLEVGYTSPSHFAQVFRRVVGVTPTEFRSSL